jgi:hypothetical protein
MEKYIKKKCFLLEMANMMRGKVVILERPEDRNFKGCEIELGVPED